MLIAFVAITAQGARLQLADRFRMGRARIEPLENLAVERIDGRTTDAQFVFLIGVRIRGWHRERRVPRVGT